MLAASSKATFSASEPTVPVKVSTPASSWPSKLPQPSFGSGACSLTSGFGLGSGAICATFSAFWLNLPSTFEGTAKRLNHASPSTFLASDIARSPSCLLPSPERVTACPSTSTLTQASLCATSSFFISVCTVR